MLTENALQVIGRKVFTKLVVGKSIDFSFTGENFVTEQNIACLQAFWHEFMTKDYPKMIPYSLDENIIAIEQYLSPNQIRKWAAVEVSNHLTSQHHPLQSLLINGEYYGFIHVGIAAKFSDSLSAAQAYLNRHHIDIDYTKPRFEIMHRSYLPDNPLSTEEFWLPVTTISSD